MSAAISALNTVILCGAPGGSSGVFFGFLLLFAIGISISVLLRGIKAIKSSGGAPDMKN